MYLSRLKPLARVKNFPTVRRAIALLVLLCSLILLAWGYWPLGRKVHSLLLSPDEMRPAQWPHGLLPAISTGRRLEVSFPPAMRVGDMASVRLALAPVAEEEALPGGNAEGVPSPSGGSPGANSIVAEARLDLPGFDVSPPGQANQAMLAGQPLNFVWLVRPDDQGTFDGTLWLHLNVLSADAQPVARQVLTAQRIQIRANRLWGISGNPARLLGSAGLVLGVVFGLDGVVAWAFGKSRS